MKRKPAADDADIRAWNDLLDWNARESFMGYNRLVRDAKDDLNFELINGERVFYLNVDSSAARETLNQRLLDERVEILRDRERQAGTRKRRRPEIDTWIDDRLKANPAAKSRALWGDAPEWITDQIGEDRFAKRVTDARKRKRVASK